MTTMYRRTRQREPWHDTMPIDDEVERQTHRRNGKWSPGESVLFMASASLALWMLIAALYALLMPMFPLEAKL